MKRKKKGVSHDARRKRSKQLTVDTIVSPVQLGLQWRHCALILGLAFGGTLMKV
jgi:hypothetical protein